MGDTIRNTGNVLKGRWMSKMPRFFYWIVVVASCIAAVAITINTSVPALGGELYPWWGEVYTHILVSCISIIVICKLTVAGGYQSIDPDKITGRTILDKDDN